MACSTRIDPWPLGTTGHSCTCRGFFDGSYTRSRPSLVPTMTRIDAKASCAPSGGVWRANPMHRIIGGRARDRWSFGRFFARHTSPGASSRCLLDVGAARFLLVGGVDGVSSASVGCR